MQYMYIVGRTEVVAVVGRVDDCPGRNTAVFGLLSALPAHTNAPYRNDLVRKMRRAPKRPRGGAGSMSSRRCPPPSRGRVCH